MGGGTGKGLAQDATLQSILGTVFGLSTPQGGTGTGFAQDASLQVLLAQLQGVGPLGQAWTDVNANANVGLTASKIGITAGSGNPITLTLPTFASMPALWTLMVSCQGSLAVPYTGLLTVALNGADAGGALFIWDPSTATFSNQRAVLTNAAGGTTAWWQINNNATQLRQIQ